MWQPGLSNNFIDYPFFFFFIGILCMWEPPKGDVCYLYDIWLSWLWQKDLWAWTLLLMLLLTTSQISSGNKERYSFSECKNLGQCLRSMVTFTRESVLWLDWLDRNWWLQQLVPLWRTCFLERWLVVVPILYTNNELLNIYSRIVAASWEDQQIVPVHLLLNSLSLDVQESLLNG